MDLVLREIPYGSRHPDFVGQFELVVVEHRDGGRVQRREFANNSAVAGCFERLMIPPKQDIVHLAGHILSFRLPTVRTFE